ncbi:3'-5'-exoribonuclease [Xylographa opegraphella]|nr:3'-5'-exoribonuclease [Xylographa opegraphella]
MTDRRRISGPTGGTAPPLLSNLSTSNTSPSLSRTTANLQRIFLKTGLTPSASGSAYLEIEQPSALPRKKSLFSLSPSPLKLTCTVHGPRPLPRTAPFAPNILLSTHVKFAPFAPKGRRGYLRETSEKDLAVHLETALRGAIVGDRWPKSGVEIIVTILEGEEDYWWHENSIRSDDAPHITAASGMMSILAGCINVASAAIVDAGLDCIDIVAGGVAAIVNKTLGPGESDQGLQVILDPNFWEHREILASCIVSYLQSRDEITELWMNGGIPHSFGALSDEQNSITRLIDGAVQAAIAARHVLVEATKEPAEHRLAQQKIMT